MTIKVGILDIGFGNLYSLCKKLSLLGAKPYLIQSPKDVSLAEKIILPGVGHFGRAFKYLSSTGMKNLLDETVLAKKTPVLGICLGMQLMATNSEEGDSNGLGWIKSKVCKFQIQDKVKYKVPQAGWNSISISLGSPLFSKIENNSEFYFLHAYHIREIEQESIASTTTYEYEFVSSIQKENIFGTQFHPEKSHSAGTQLLKNFITL